MTIPAGVTSIGEWAFKGCSGLTSVTIPDSVTSIGDEAFCGCSGLTNVTIPNSVTSIGSGAFSGCSGLTSVTIPDSATYIAYNAFDGCVGVTNIIVDSGNPRYSSRDGLLLDKDGAVLLGSINGDIVIPSGVTSIDSWAFSGCSGLTSVTIPDSVTSIGRGAFSGCSGLTSVTIPSSVTCIHVGAFEGCVGVTNITVDSGNPFYSSRNGLQLNKNGSKLVLGINGDVVISDGVTRIGHGAFEGRIGLTSVAIPDGVTRIVYSAFEGCIGLTNVVIPDSVTRIDGHAFEGCIGLTSVTIPSSVTYIGVDTFRDCNGLVHVRLPRRFERIPDLREDVFSGCNENLVLDYYDEVPRSSYEVAVVYDAVGGTVTGGGTYAAGKRVVLKATAKKGYVLSLIHI